MDSQVQSTRTILTALMVTFVILLVTVDAEAQSTFTVQPVSVIQAEGLEAVYECLHSGSTGYAWFVNGLINTDPNFPLNASTGGGLRGSPGTLTIPARPEYNNTVVQCRVVVIVGGTSAQLVLSDSATLSVQGPLEAVSALVVSSRSVSSILISWMPPFSLDLTTAEPDIVYCVDIYNVTGGGTELVETKCNIIDTSYLFSPDNLSPDYIFNFIVTPVSNVAGSQNGTKSQPVQASTCRAQSTFTVQPVSVIQAEGLEAVFECLYPGATLYGWLLNGLISTDLNYPLDASTGGGLRGSPDTLTIPARPEYNNTVVQCRATVEVGGAPQYVLSDSATLSVQGTVCRN